MSAHGAASPAAWDRGRGVLSAGPLARLAAGTQAMALAELRKLRHDHIDVFTRSVQPLLWLFIFGTALRHTRSLTLDYRAYLAPGVMAQAAMFIAIFFGLAVIWERDVGQLQRLLADAAAPRRAAPRSCSERRSARACARSYRRSCCSRCSPSPESPFAGQCWARPARWRC